MFVALLRADAALHETDVDRRVRVRQPREVLADPSDDWTSSVTPFFARIVLYFCAAFQYVLPGGPDEITSVDGGAGWISLTASQTAAPASSTVGPIDSARSRHDTATKRARMRRGGRGRAGFMGAADDAGVTYR